MKAGLLYTAIMLARAVLFSSLPPDHHRLTWLLKSGKLRCANVSYIIMHLHTHTGPAMHFYDRSFPHLEVTL